VPDVITRGSFLAGRLARALTVLSLALAGCTRGDGAGELRAGELPPHDGHLFTRLPSAYTGLRFVNRIEETRDLNVFTYRNYYNGGGVAAGDLSGDGRPDLVLTANVDGPRVYLNRGAFRFRDVTSESRLEGKGFWATGVTLADVNGDGRLDVYVCYAGDVDGARRGNELFVNTGTGADSVPVFEERAKEYGIDDRGYSTHAVFFDYDRDGDLDLYLLNNSFRPVSSFGLRNIRHVRDSLGGHKLFRNEGGRFSDVSERAGIYGSEIAFGLGVGVSDVNRDGWPDIYVANDFFERDYLYINQRDGTFAESLEQVMPSISYFSMGLDIADVNNDGWPDVYTTDMLPEDEYRFKSMFAFEGWDVYQAKLRNDYHHQLSRNMLQLNNANGTFSDIGWLSGTARTDWSWSALIADFDEDGQKDIFVTNGIAKDLTSQDYIAFLANDETMRAATKGRRVDFMGLIEAMSETKLPNYAFRNRGDLTFENRSAAWGLDTPSFSNGAAYVDLDGDGALDLVVNNIDDEAFVYRNNARALGDNHWLQLRLEGEGANRFAIGAKVTLRRGDTLFFQELVPSRGFQSSVDPVLTFGTGPVAMLHEVLVEWPDGRATRLRDVATNQRLTVRQSEATDGAPAPKRPAPRFADVTSALGVDVVHRENDFVDFDRERLIPKLLSTEGPFLAVGDVNADGLDDAYVGGAKDQPGRLLVQRSDGRFASSNEPLFARDAICEDLGAVFFDANGDGALDLYVVSGGNEYSDGSGALQDRLYVNDGRGGFRKAADALPMEFNSGSRVAAADFDRDGDVDLFVGGRVVLGRYGLTPTSMLLANDGRGRFRDVAAEVAPGLAGVGMATDAVWRDVDGDRRPDLVVVGEWMPVTIFRNTASGRFERMDVAGLRESEGWWNRIVAADVDDDGDTDFIVGNLGLNSRLRATPAEPMTMYVKDFDNNGFVEQIVGVYNGGKSYPLALRDDLIKTLPYLKTRYLNYRDYATQTVSQLFPPADLAGATLRQARTFATSLVRNDGNGAFTLVPLPREAQLAPVYGIDVSDVDGDGKRDLLLAGNFDGVKPEIGRMAASEGLWLRGDGRGSFSAVRPAESGFFVPGQARDIQRIRTRAGEIYAVTRNNDGMLLFRAARPATVAGARPGAR
jgi:hypothetical protein